MKKQPFGISIVSVVIIGIGSLLSSCDFRMSVKDRTGETQEYTAESAAAENTLPLEVVKYQQLDINQIGKGLCHYKSACKHWRNNCVCNHRFFADQFFDDSGYAA